MGACRWMGVGGEWVTGCDIQTPATFTPTYPLPNANVHPPDSSHQTENPLICHFRNGNGVFLETLVS